MKGAMKDFFSVKPIGIIRTGFNDKSSAPVQGVLSDSAAGSVEVFSEFADGLKDLDGFSHIYLIYMFDRAGEVQLVRKPFLDDSPRGLFSTRHPCRPNGIGITVVELKDINGRFLEVGGIDVLDGTPLLDIKPYIKRFDSFPMSSEGWIENIQTRLKPAGRE